MSIDGVNDSVGENAATLALIDAGIPLYFINLTWALMGSLGVIKNVHFISR